VRLSDEPKPGERSLARREKHEQRRGIGVWTLDADRESCKEHHPRACAESSRSLAIPLALGSRRSGRPRIRQTRPSWGRYPPAFGRVASFEASPGPRDPRADRPLHRRPGTGRVPRRLRKPIRSIRGTSRDWLPRRSGCVWNSSRRRPSWSGSSATSSSPASGASAECIGCRVSVLSRSIGRTRSRRRRARSRSCLPELSLKCDPFLGGGVATWSGRTSD